MLRLLVALLVTLLLPRGISSQEDDAAIGGVGATGGGVVEVAASLPQPRWPDDFQWSSSGIPDGYDCIAITEKDEKESASSSSNLFAVFAPTSTTWEDNYFCWRQGTANPNMRWSTSGPLKAAADGTTALRCTLILEPHDILHTWHDNYLCVDQSSPLLFSWSYSGLPDEALSVAEVDSTISCIQWLEPADPAGWNDNYLCAPNTRGDDDDAVTTTGNVHPLDGRLQPEDVESEGGGRAYLSFIGLIVMLQSLFFTNYFYIKNLRRRIDEDFPKYSFFITEERIDQMTTAFNKTLLFLFDPEKLSKERRKEEESRLREKKMLWLVGIIQGLFLNQLRKEPGEEKQFIGWKPIPNRKGQITTSLLLILSAVVLSPRILGDDIKEMLTPDLCIDSDSSPLLKLLSDELEVDTNLVEARQQANYYAELAKNLKKDTSLYGTAGFECPNVEDESNTNVGTLSGRKVDWLQSPDEPPMTKFGEFFPGYCAASRAQALENARSATCTKEVCINDLAVKIAGFFTGKGHCRTVTFACPKHTDDQVIETEDYRDAQEQRAQEEHQALKAFEERANDKFDGIQSKVGETVERIFFQIEVASNLFVGYKVLSIFLPAPLDMFRPSFNNLIRNNLFGVQSTAFTAVIVAIWWGVEYFHMFAAHFQVYFNLDYLKSPCYADKDFLKARAEIIAGKCDELITLSNQVSLDNITIHHISLEVLAFQNECNCAFPNVNTQMTGIPYAVAQYGYESVDVCGATCTEDSKIPDALEVNGEEVNDLIAQGAVIPPGNLKVYYPKYDLPFLANDTVCFDLQYTRKQYMMPPKSDASFWDVWMRSGLLAMILIRLFIAVLGFWLLRLADPFSCCDGKYNSPPPRYSVADNEENLKEMKEDTVSALTFIARKQVIFYIVGTNIALLNLIVVVAKSRDGHPRKYIAYFGVVVGVAITVPLSAALFWNKDRIFSCFKKEKAAPQSTLPSWEDVKGTMDWQKTTPEKKKTMAGPMQLFGPSAKTDTPSTSSSSDKRDKSDKSASSSPKIPSWEGLKERMDLPLTNSSKKKGPTADQPIRNIDPPVRNLFMSKKDDADGASPPRKGTDSDNRWNLPSCETTPTREPPVQTFSTATKNPFTMVAKSCTPEKKPKTSSHAIVNPNSSKYQQGNNGDETFLDSLGLGFKCW